MLELEIGDKSSFIVIRVIGRERTEATNYDDANWLTAEAEIQLGDFRGSTKSSLVTTDFITFKEELSKLQDTLKGTAEFSTIEEWINISITGNGRGNLDLDCFLTSFDYSAKLQFKFTLDQTYLSQLLRQLDLILAEYPEIGSR